MSRAWRPRAHPERCDDEMRYDPDVPGEELAEQEREHRRVSTQIEWTWLILVAVLLGLALLYREGTLGWWWQWVTTW